jgi:hypothetical protein
MSGTHNQARPVGRPKYVAYPKAMKLLAERLGASPDELAAWVFFGPGPGLGGIAAFVNANELDPPLRFHYGTPAPGDFDYLSPLMACWFQEDDITRFEPIERYITGKALIERWSKHPGIQPEGYILAKIRESRLVGFHWESRLDDFHPTCGGTQVSFPDAGTGSLPPLDREVPGSFLYSRVRQLGAATA